MLWLVAGGHALFGDGAPAPVVSQKAAEAEHFRFQFFDDLGFELFVELIEDCAIKHGRGGVHERFLQVSREWMVLYVTTIGDRDGSLFTGLTMRHEPRGEDCQFS